MTCVQFYSKTKLILIAGKLGLLPLSKAEAVGGEAWPDPPTHLPRHQLCNVVASGCQHSPSAKPINLRKIRRLSEPLGGHENWPPI